MRLHNVGAHSCQCVFDQLPSHAVRHIAQRRCRAAVASGHGQTRRRHARRLQNEANEFTKQAEEFLQQAREARRHAAELELQLDRARKAPMLSDCGSSAHEIRPKASPLFYYELQCMKCQNSAQAGGWLAARAGPFSGQSPFQPHSSFVAAEH